MNKMKLIFLGFYKIFCTFLADPASEQCRREKTFLDKRHSKSIIDNKEGKINALAGEMTNGHLLFIVFLCA